MIQKMLQILEETYPMIAADPGEYGKMKVSGMTFRIRSFEAQGLGHVSAMEASGFFGLMKMDTLIITPTQVDLPLFAYDRAKAMGKDTLFLELYDTITGNTELSALEKVSQMAAGYPEHRPESNWYDHLLLPQSVFKKGKKADGAAFDGFAEEFLRQLLSVGATAEGCDPQQKRQRAGEYVEGLLTHGGPATNVFKKAIGQEKTAFLFRKILFGTQL